MPGKVYAAVLPDDLSCFDDEHPLPMAVIRDNMLKNHGYYRVREKMTDTSVISADNGVFRFIPPETAEGEWTVEQLLDSPASDAALVDLDGDGEKELAVLSPFHGDQISIYKKKNHGFEKVYDYEKKTEFTHAIYAGTFCGRQALIVGHRKGERNLLAFFWDEQKKTYQSEIIDADCGSANVYYYEHQGKSVLISANREIDEVAMYTIKM
jgi:hypothetical protein